MWVQQLSLLLPLSVNMLLSTISLLAICYIILLDHCCIISFVLTTRPGSPDWDSILQSPIVENIPSTSSSGKSEHNDNHSQENAMDVSSTKPEIPQWAAKKPLSKNRKAINQREKLSKLKREDYESYLLYREKRNKRTKERKSNFTESELQAERKSVSEAQKRFAQRRKILFQDPANTEQRKKNNKLKTKSSNAYIKKLVADVRSGTASDKRLRQYENRRIKKNENSRRRYAMKKAENLAARGSDKNSENA